MILAVFPSGLPKIIFGKSAASAGKNGTARIWRRANTPLGQKIKTVEKTVSCTFLA
jgi:hypothetical protein